MTKVVYNASYGGFGLSYKAMCRYAELKGYVVSDNCITDGYGKELYDCDIERDDPDLVRVVEELGNDASGHWAKLRIEDIPKGTFYRIDEYDGYESVCTKEDYDWKMA